MTFKPITVPGRQRTPGYSDGMLVTGPSRLLFVAGQIGWDENQRIVSQDFVEQFKKALENVMAVVHAAGGNAGSIARLTIYVTDKREYAARTAEVGRRIAPWWGSISRRWRSCRSPICWNRGPRSRSRRPPRSLPVCRRVRDRGVREARQIFGLGSVPSRRLADRAEEMVGLGERRRARPLGEAPGDPAAGAIPFELADPADYPAICDARASSRASEARPPRPHICRSERDANNRRTAARPLATIAPRSGHPARRRRAPADGSSGGRGGLLGSAVESASGGSAAAGSSRGQSVSRTSSTPPRSARRRRASRQ